MRVHWANERQILAVDVFHQCELNSRGDISVTLLLVPLLDVVISSSSHWGKFDSQNDPVKLDSSNSFSDR